MFSQVEQLNLAYILRFLLFYCDDIDDANAPTVSAIWRQLSFFVPFDRLISVLWV